MKLKKGLTLFFVVFLLVALLAAVFPGAISQAETSSKTPLVTDWPMFHHDPANIGYSTSRAPDTINILWKFKVPNIGWESPSVADGKVFLPLGRGVYAINETTGKQLWSFRTGGRVSKSVAYSDGKVFFGSRDRNIYALNANTGKQIWKYTTGGKVDGRPTVGDGMVFIGSRDHNLYTLNANTGKQIWKYKTKDRIDGAPAVADGRVFVCSGHWTTDTDQNIYCLDESNGNLIWKFNRGGWGSDSPAVKDGIVYVGCGEPANKVYALNAKTGKVIWSFQAGRDPNPIAVGYGKVFFGEAYKKFYALDASTGKLLWTFGTTGNIVSAPAVADGKVFFGAGGWVGPDNHVYALNAFTGALIWKYDTGEVVFSSPAVADGKVFIGSDGYLYCFCSLLDKIEAKLDDEIRFTSDEELSGHQEVVVTQIDENEREFIEQALFERKPLVYLWIDKKEEVKSIVWNTIEKVKDLGYNTEMAEKHAKKADQLLAKGKYKAAWHFYSIAYRSCAMVPPMVPLPQVPGRVGK